MNQDDLIAYLSEMDPEELNSLLSKAFTPYQQEQDVLNQEMAMAQQMGQRQPDRRTPSGAFFGGLSNAIGQIGGAYKQNQALEGQRALGRKMQENAVAQTRAGLGTPGPAYDRAMTSLDAGSPMAQVLRRFRTNGTRGTSPADLALLMGDK